jgi:SPP1 family predicted phage head-tail adaptor
MNIGQLDRQIEIKQIATAKDEWNYDVITQSTLATVWAQKVERLAGELVGESQLVSQNRVDWIIRHRTDLTASMTIVYSGNAYDIKGMKELGRKEGLLIHSELRDNA